MKSENVKAEVMTQQKAIEDLTKEDFLTTTLPYEMLFECKDEFKQLQMQNLMNSQAKKQKITNFTSLYKKFLQQYHPTAKVVMLNVTEFDGQELQLTCGRYYCENGGITIEDYKGDIQEVCNHPIMPVKRLVNIDDNTEKLKIAYRKGHRWREIVADKETLASSSKIVQLAKYGVAVNSENAKLLVQYFTDIENYNFDKIPEYNSVGRLGWINNHGFSPYVDDLIFDGEESFRTIFNSVHYEGEIEDWVNLCKKIRMENNVCSKIMLAASFSSALVDLCDCLPFFVHLWGGTESGKTVALMFAASVWASPSMGDYIRSFNSTAVAQELTAGFVNSLPLIYDELQIIKDNKNFDNMIYKLCEGVGRDRGKKSGGVQKILTWRNCILTSGEYPISNAASGAGAINRIIEIDCKDQKIFDNPAKICSVIKHNYGGAGAYFVHWLQDKNNAEKAREIRLKLNQELNKENDITDKQAMSASLILTADKLINELFFNDNFCLTPHDLKPFLVTKEAVNQNKRCYEFINDFVAANYNKFVPDSDGNYRGEIFGELTDKYTFFIKSKFDAVLSENGYNPRAFLSWAAKNGLIIVERGHNTKTKRIFKKVCRCVCIINLADEFISDEPFNSNDDLEF